MTKKQTTREKLITKAALVYADIICKSRVLDDFNVSVQEMIGVAFFQGARLADENPRRGLVKIEDVRAIYCEWLKYNSENSTFLEYFANYCDKEGWV